MIANWRHFLTAAVLFVLSSSAAAAQQGATVTGRVTADDGRPIQGANITISQLGLMASSSDDGRYSLVVPADQVRGQQVQVNALRIGYRAAEATITLNPGTITQDFELTSTPALLSEVVITALGIEREKRALGVAVQELQGAELAAAPEVNIVNSLSGKVSGVQVTNAGPQGGSSRVVIRGANSISGQNQPLFIVDGVPVDNSAPMNTWNNRPGYGGIDYGNAVQDLNPQDIESVSVLKGPNAAALYGSRAANGAIIITTKRGQRVSGQGIGIVASQTLTFETPLRLPEYQNLYGQGSGFAFAYVDGAGGGVNDGVDESWGPPLDGRMIPQFHTNGAPAPWVASPNNVNDFFDTGRTSTTAFSVSGGSERGRVRLSAAKMQQTGMFPNSRLDRLNTSLTGDVALTDKLDVSGSVHYTSADGRNRPGTGYDGANPMLQFIWFGRQVDTRILRQQWMDEDGFQVNWNHNYHNNPYWLAYQNPNNDSRDRVIGSATVNYRINEWLNATGRVGTDWYRDWRKRAWDRGTIGGMTVDEFGNFFDVVEGGFWEDHIYNREDIAEGLLSARRSLSESFDLSVTAGAARRTAARRFNSEGTDRIVVRGVYNIANSAVAPIVSAFERAQRVNSLFGSAQLAFNDYLFVEATGRNDWSSTLPEGNNSYFYPSISTSFIFTEVFPATQGLFTYGKLRASLARVGNDASPYQTRSVYSASTPFGGIPRYSVPNTLANTNLKPETTDAFELGTELRFLSDRALLDVTYYKKSTDNQILATPVSAASGVQEVVLNAGRIDNEGVEALLSAKPVQLSNGFEWEVTLNWAMNRSTVAELYGDIATVSLNGTGYWALTVEARKGEQYGALYGSDFERDAQGRIVVDEFGLPMPSAKKVLGHFTPDWTGGIANTLRYRNFDLSFLFDLKQGGEFFSVTGMFGQYTGVLSETVNPCIAYPTIASACDGRESMIVNGVDADGNPNTVEIAAEDFFKSLYGIHGAFVYDASYIKLRELKLGYTVPQELAGKVGASSMYVAIIGRNLWLSTPTPHMDPETAFNAGNAQGLEFGQLPSARSVGFNLVVTP